MKKLIKRIIGMFWGIYCPVCAGKVEYVGYYQERIYCPKCGYRN